MKTNYKPVSEFKQMMCQWFCCYSHPCKSCPMNNEDYYRRPIRDMIRIEVPEQNMKRRCEL